MRTPVCYALGFVGLGTVAGAMLRIPRLPRVQIAAAARPTGQPPAPFEPHLLRPLRRHILYYPKVLAFNIVILYFSAIVTVILLTTRNQ